MFNYLSSRYKNKDLGIDGLLSFIFSNIILLISFGLPFFYLLYKVIKTASSSSVFPHSSGKIHYILVLGVKLDKNKIGKDFINRLDRAVKLEKSYSLDSDDKFNENTIKPPSKLVKVMILGGITHGNSISEAEAGQHYLISQQLNQERIILENDSKHTLGNLTQARLEIKQSHALMISNRYHLYRSMCLVEGLKLKITPIAAEDEFSFSFANTLLYLKEAYLVHWYFSGKIGVAITKNKASQQRIS